MTIQEARVWMIEEEFDKWMDDGFEQAKEIEEK